VTADFGCAEFSTREKADPNTPTYRALGTGLPPKDGSITPSYDIWALGCVCLGFLTWWYGDWTLVAEFASQPLSPDPSFSGLPEGFNVRADFLFAITKEDGKATAKIRDRVKKVSNCHGLPANLQ